MPSASQSLPLYHILALSALAVFVQQSLVSTYDGFICASTDVHARLVCVVGQHTQVCRRGRYWFASAKLCRLDPLTTGRVGNRLRQPEDASMELVGSRQRFNTKRRRQVF
jgi:hypothetical protein